MLAGPDLRNEIKIILFPGTRALSGSDERDVQHLAEHVRTGGHIFVTTDKGDFMSGNREKKLQSLGIWAIEPKKAVELLVTVYGWSQDSGI